MDFKPADLQISFYSAEEKIFINISTFEHKRSKTHALCLDYDKNKILEYNLIFKEQKIQSLLKIIF